MERQENTRIEFGRVVSGIRHDQVPPRASLPLRGKLQGCAQAFLQMLAAIQPARSFYQTGFVPAAQTEAEGHAREGNQGSSGYNLQWQRNQVMNANNKQGKACAYKKSEP